MLRHCLLTSLLFLTAFSTYSQVQETQVEQKNNIAIENQPIEEENQEEPKLSMEEQGFKKIQTGNTFIYRKEVNGIIIEFRPEEK